MREQLDKEKREMEKKISEEQSHQRKLEEMQTEIEERLHRLKLKRVK